MRPPHNQIRIRWIAPRNEAISYIRTSSDWLHPTAVIDLYSRKTVGWAMASAMPAQLVCAAFGNGDLQPLAAKRVDRGRTAPHFLTFINCPRALENILAPNPSAALRSALHGAGRPVAVEQMPG